MDVDVDAQGTTYEVGQQLGRQLAKLVREDCEPEKVPNLPSPFRSESVDEWLLKSWGLSQQYAPRTSDFIRGLSAGSEVSLPKLFLSWCEEIFDFPRKADRGCTDILVDRTATSTGDLLVAHTNDEAPSSRPALTRLSVSGLPTILGFFSGSGPSVATNTAGLVLSGNQIESKDIKPGIPRLVLYQEACWSPSIQTAINTIMHPLRASSYNYVLADDLGNFINLEATATNFAELHEQDDYLVHTNHHVLLPEMEARDLDRLDASRLRREHASRFCRENHGSINLQSLADVLRSHGPGGLCRHEHDVKTVFGVLIAPEHRRLWYRKGSPCTGAFLPVSY